MQFFSKPLFDTRGFSLLQIGAVVAVLMVVGTGAGLLVRSTRHDDTPKAQVLATSGRKVTEEQTAQPTDFAPQAVVPEGFNVYKDDTAGFSFAYPSGWGALTTLNTNLLTTQDVTKIGSDTHGALTVVTSGLGSMFRPTPFEHGPTLRPEAAAGSISWKVVQTGDVYDGYALDSAYNAKVIRVLTSGSNMLSSISVYEFATTQNGKTTVSWIFATPTRYVYITLPYLSEAYDYDGHPIPGDKQAYTDLRKQILQSIEISSLVQ